MKYICLVIFCFISIISYSSNFNQSQIEISIEISRNNDNILKSSASGDLLLEYNGYYLFDIISEITNIPSKYFLLNDNIKNPIVKFKATSSKKIERTALIESLIATLNKNLNIDLEIKKKNIEVNILYYKNPFEERKNKCNSNYIESSLSIVNRTFKSKCINTDKLVEQLNKWYALRFFNELDKEGRYNFDLHHSNYIKELISELNYYYSIDIKKELRKVEVLIITSNL